MIWTGYIEGTHGLDGKVKIKNKFSKEELIYKEGFTLYIDKVKYHIDKVKPYKKGYIVKFKEISNIDEGEKLIGKDVYIDREDLKIDGYLLEDLPLLKVISNDKEYGIVTGVYEGSMQNLIEVDNKILVPIIDEYINKVNLEEKVIYINDIERLIL